MSGAMATVTPIKPRIDARHAEEETDAQGRPRRDSGLPPRPIRVLVADDEREIRLALTDLINDEPGLELVGAAKDADEAIEIAKVSRPDIVMLDVVMPHGGGPRAAREIKAANPMARLLALSAHDDAASVREMLSEGASGYLVKGCSVEEIVQAIKRTAEGEATLSAQVTTHVVSDLARELKRNRRQWRRREELIERIKRVIEGHDLAMHYQPVVCLDDGHVIGYEALARFLGEPSRSAMAWFAEAEDVGLGPELELTAAEAALQVIPLLPADTFLSINLSPQTANSPAFRELLPAIPRDRLVVEMTEHVPVADYPKLNGAFRELRWDGVRVAIDDVGAGYASLRHILELRPDFIKLDLTLTRDIDVESARRSLTSALVSFADDIGVTIIAEGIESEREVETLRTLGVHYGQGFHLGPPAPWPRTEGAD